MDASRRQRHAVPFGEGSSDEGNETFSSDDDEEEEDSYEETPARQRRSKSMPRKLVSCRRRWRSPARPSREGRGFLPLSRVAKHFVDVSERYRGEDDQTRAASADTAAAAAAAAPPVGR